MNTIRVAGGGLRGATSAVVCVMAVLVGCGSDEEGGPGNGNGEPTVPFTPGAPVDVTPMEWHYVSVPGTKCRDGQETGFGININPASNKLILYFEGGGACFNGLTCTMNPRSWGESNLGTPGGVLRRDDTNQFADWNLVYVPYCTGDVFTGTKETGGYNDEPQQGYINVGRYLERIVPTFPNLDQVVLSGSSAGGFGVAWNWMRTQDAFGDIPVYALDDSGPTFGPDYFSPCLTRHMASTWGWESSIHPACTDCNIETGEVNRPFMEVAVMREGAHRFALLSNTEDSVIKLFFGFGLDDCSGINSIGPTYPTGQFPMGLAELRTEAEPYDHVKQWVKTGTSHTFLGNVAGEVSEGVELADWIEQFHTDDPAWTDVFPAL